MKVDCKRYLLWSVYATEQGIMRKEKNHMEQEKKRVGKVYGYARISSADQNESRQLLTLQEVDVPKQNIYVDKLSGKNFERPQYRKMIKK